ncbi:guanine nucleotide-binding protein subunit alpha-11-like isoform X2 [Sinocyclocheilus anshuiensis]|nr:PREDICTED: guanine nucleotide-binding protein subunit alpha-11-like isoform X2 [Sinocyclocheilus anshuiensis]XP_016327190.1 PREDICTED: guanine nucleotide-binding protein subunit alpha-11-like isoform X2 [Sinocyclocheilus anshuiensis]
MFISMKIDYRFPFRVVGFSNEEMGDHCGCCICCLSKKKRNVTTKNNEINILTEQEKESEMRLLLLGTRESGKKTFMKQLRIIHGSGYSEDERRSYTKLVFQNIFQAMSEMTDAMKTLKIPYSNPQNEIYAQWVQEQDIHQITQLPWNHAQIICHLWADKGIKICYSRRREYQLLDSIKYFIGNMARIVTEDYIPTYQDILHVRSPTDSITEQCISFEKTILRFVEVSGQRGLRRKWIHCFENVTSIIFLASLSEYDQSLEENNKDNRMEESLSLFYTTIHSPWFANSFILLLLNKMDILSEKVQFSDLKTYFPRFEGKRQDVQDAMQFIAQLYKQKGTSKETEDKRVIYPHFICATDTIDIRALFHTVKHAFMSQLLRKYEVL